LRASYFYIFFISAEYEKEWNENCFTIWKKNNNKRKIYIIDAQEGKLSLILFEICHRTKLK
jgi:hypothetical protein